MKITCDSCENCTKCKDICCYYKENEKECSPIFTKDDAEKIEKKLGKGFFKQLNKEKTLFRLILKKSEKHKNYICPFFNEKTKKCTIYELRPLDCILFPFTFVRRNNQIYLGIINDKDMCPFMKDLTEKDIEESRKRIVKKIKKDKIGEILRKYPEMIFDYEGVKLLGKIDLDKI